MLTIVDIGIDGVEDFISFPRCDKNSLLQEYSNQGKSKSHSYHSFLEEIYEYK